MKSKLRFILTFVLIFALVMLVSEALPSWLGDASAPPAATAQTAEESGELTLLPPDEADEPTPAVPLPDDGQAPANGDQAIPDEDGAYDSKEELALYIHTYGHLPKNFVTKAEAEAAGWTGGSLDRVMPGMAIGGNRYHNREGLLPTAKGRTWTECDVNSVGRSSRGPERIVFSNDGLIYYTPDHYESFELLYGEP